MNSSDWSVSVSACQRAAPFVVEPEVFQFVLQIQLPPDAPQQAVVPLFGGQILPDGRQIRDGDLRLGFLAQTRRFATGGSGHAVCKPASSQEAYVINYSFYMIY
jgi:hypothetical protein